MNLFDKPARFLGEVKAELGKVSWSSKQELIGATGVVIGLTAIMATFIFIVDFFLTRFVTFMFR
ncbi:MAG: preprotein translocase subunit SecE [Candidatus Omnitrophota bacterium]|jgi:preprotein translocase SecE subunit|nr:preprotein translocase subunit SecE [Candidatus Omnitrophota bacterium]